MNQKPNYGNWVPEKLLYLTFGRRRSLSGACTAVRSCFLKHAPRGHLRHSLRRSARLRHLYVCVPRMLCLWKRRYDGKGSRTSGRPSQLGRTRHASRHRLRRCPAHHPLCQGIPGRSAHRHGLLGRAVELRQRAVRKKAAIEGVASRIHFEKGDAAHLNYADETFDAAVSNFVFHEVHSARDKRDVVREALRVVKRGGAFSFQDLFAQKSLYGDMDAFVEELKKEGISEIHYIGNLEKTLDFVPAYVRTPWMISGMGILYGKK